MKRVFVLFAYAFILMMAAGCAVEQKENKAAPSPIAALPQNQAGEVVKRAIAFAGGWEKWAAMQTVQYQKTTTQFNDDGSVKKKMIELHQYVLQPQLRVRFAWEDEGKQYASIYSGWHGWKLIDGQLAATTQDSLQARNPSLGSHYNFCMPFKLTDPGTTLTYLGQAQLDNGVMADKVCATYEKGASDAGGLHTWTFYFDSNDGRLVANHFQSGDRFSFTEYADHKIIDGIHMPTRRYGYRSNEKAEKAARTSEISYEDIRFNAPLADSLFMSPKS